MSRISTHPGEILREEFMVPLGLGDTELAEALGLPRDRIAKIKSEQRSITSDTAIRFGEFFGTTPEFWMNLQKNYDLSKAQREFAPRTLRTIRSNRKKIGRKQLEVA